MRQYFIFLLFGVMLLMAKMPAMATSAVPTDTSRRVVDDRYKNIATMKLKEFQQLMGRKLSFKEKAGFFVLKLKMKHQQKDADKQGKIALVLGLVGLGLLLVSFLAAAPALLIVSLLSSISAIVTGSTVNKKDGVDRNAKAGKLLGWLTVGVMGFILILGAIWLANWNWH